MGKPSLRFSQSFSNPVLSFLLLPILQAMSSEYKQTYFRKGKVKLGGKVCHRGWKVLLSEWEEEPVL